MCRIVGKALQSVAENGVQIAEDDQTGGGTGGANLGGQLNDVSQADAMLERPLHSALNHRTVS